MNWNELKCTAIAMGYKPDEVKVVLEEHASKNSKEAANSTAPNNERDVICSTLVCDYCLNEGCGCTPDWCCGFKGRKLAPVS